jgi:alpha-beta hydrolase superfamily lysophospholipase
MLVDLMSTTTSDGIELDGAFFPAAPGVAREGPVDAVLIMHGSHGNFYTTSNLNMAQALSAQGYASLSLNAVAHDNVWATSDNYYGNAYDILDRCRLDIRAGVDYLWELGFRSIGILGFSMGAVRVAYYAASEDDQRVTTVIPVSPVRLSYTYYMESPDAAEFQGIIQWADQMEAEDRAMDLMAVKFPIAQLFSAASYLDKHGPAERYNMVTLAPRIRIPILVIGGSLETHTRLLDMARDLTTASVNSPRAECVIVEGGNHSISNMPGKASEAVLNWLASLAPRKVAV